jgi:hypothetical protein
VAADHDSNLAHAVAPPVIGPRLDTSRHSAKQARHGGGAACC